MGRDTGEGRTLAVDTERLPRTLVRVRDLNLRDRTFEIRGHRPARTRAQRDTPRRPIIWGLAPYTLVRGFRYLEDLRAIAADTGRDHFDGEEVEVAWLRSPGRAWTAMWVACTPEAGGGFQLTAQECARAVRRLHERGVPKGEVKEFLGHLELPRRTLVRAHRIARAPAEIWDLLESGKITVAAAEAVM